MQKRFSEEQIVGILRETETGGRSIGEVCRAHSVSESAVAMSPTLQSAVQCPREIGESADSPQWP
jgi:transposase-like protein